MRLGRKKREDQEGSGEKACRNEELASLVDEKLRCRVARKSDGQGPGWHSPLETISPMGANFFGICHFAASDCWGHTQKGIRSDD